MELKEFSELKGLYKRLEKDEKAEKEAEAKAKVQAAQTGGMGRRPRPDLKPDGSNATIDDYFPHGSEPYIEDKGLVSQRPAPSEKSSRYRIYDLHIDKIQHPRNLPANQFLPYQMRRFREIMDENLPHKGRRLVIIHGQGEGVLRSAIIKELDDAYFGCEYDPARTEEFGYRGALLITIK